MEEKTITCRYTFTKAQFKRAMRIYWRKSPRARWTILFIILITGILIAVNLFEGPKPVAATGLTFTAIISDMVPAVIFLVFVTSWVTFKSNRTFRRGALFNEPITSVLSDSGCSVQMAAVDSKVKWSILTAWSEGRDGFLVFLKGERSFYWFPKDGFTSPENFDQTRTLLQAKVKKR